MFPPNSDSAGQGGGTLEERLRGLILSNSDPMLIPGAARPGPTPGLQPSHMPPPMLPSNFPGQHEGSHPPAPPQPPFENAPNSLTPGLSSPPGRKRPNQAQRRQMNAQLSIPIDPRPNPGVQAGRGNSFYGPPNTQYGQQNFVNRSPHQPHRYNPQPHQQYSPRFQNQGPASPYSPLTNYQQHSPQSPMHHDQPASNAPSHPRQSPNHFSPQHQTQQNAYTRPPPQSRHLYQPGSQAGYGGRAFGQNSQELTSQSSHLEWLVERYVPGVGIEPQEEAEKEVFRAVVEVACREAISEHEQIELGNEQFDPSTVQLQCFGSMRSGFATKASDMDLALLTPRSVPAADSPESVIPRILEKKLLELGYGARLLTRTRVPIIKLCQKPTGKLMSDLLQERQKWEGGFTSDHEDDDDHHEAMPSPVVDESSQKEGVPSLSPAVEHHQTANTESYDEKLASLKQKRQQSLGDYCNLAKRLLRRLGGRDITLNSPDLNEKESKILNDVCKAFISGLASEALSTRLRQYQSISPLFDQTLPFVQRSIHGIWTQIEGERLAMAWDSRPLTEPDDKLEYEALNLVEAWRKLQDRTGALMEPTIYNRQLFMASEKLKKITSIQLVALEQIQHEDPVYYQARAQKIMDELIGRGQSFLGSSVTPIVVAHYISGIGNERIRDILQTTDHGETTLSQVGLHHRVLQLALDFEHALEVGVFEDSDRHHVEQYVTLLRSRKFGGAPSSPNEDDAELIAKVRNLPDPTLTSLNRPRDRYKDHLEFPKTDIGIQCDINFSAQLAIHNTQLLRCYSQSDPRVKIMILFIKHWAKVRGVNTPYRGTLSSYGYVLMVLHYLVNIAQPFVCPNLQLIHKEPPSYLPPAEIEALATCQGRDVRFWRNEGEIKNLADRKMLNHNHDSIGLLLRGFFEYYGQTGQMSTVSGRGFDWGREVLSLRTQGGILSKQEKGWVGAKTIIQTTTIAAPPTPSSATTPDVIDQPDVSLGLDTPKTSKLHTKTVEETKEIRHRYLFAIEDPFELDHNVARTVTHNGIVSIRDEFRRAWKIIKGIGKPWEGNDGQLLDPILHAADEKSGLQALMNLIHGPAPAATPVSAAQAEVEKVETAAQGGYEG
ncbi:caffeine-induced death protein-like protein [Cadophora sp. MPI-SDFR-AT-0126]|nr:caffeine-induced death protein-like protein [Leotiomycetes sp. MPI-SDFR-AT-0126]